MFPFSQNERLVFSYIWLIGSRLFGIYLVMYVLGRATDRTEILIVTVAGMMFGVISSLMYLQQHQMYSVLKLVANSLILSQKKSNESPMTDDEYKEVKEFIADKILFCQHRSAILQMTSLVIFVLCFMRFAPLFSLFGG